jgi:FkbM family methyltransferase
MTSVLELPPKMYVFGSGSFASRLIRSLTAAGIHVVGIIDWPERAGIVLDGYRVSSLEEGLDLELPVVIGIHNPDADVRNVKSRLTGIGVEVVISPPQIVELLYRKNETFSNYWLSPQLEAPIHIAEIDFVNSILSDEKSNNVFDSSIRYRNTGQIEDLPAPDSLVSQYFPRDIPDFFENLRDLGAFVDVGAYTGDTLKSLALTEYRPETYIGLEPDLHNFQKLLLEARRFTGKSLCFPLAASENVGWASFTSSGASSAVVDGDGIPVQTVNLDFLANINVSYIKMDIEGSELSALRGAEVIIRRDKPILAISIYHKPGDLVEIPSYLFSLGVYRRFYMRCYGDQLFDTVLYCLPG